MGRTLLGSLAGAGIGFVVACALIAWLSGGERGSDTRAITLFVGTFLAGAGAIAGAIVGAVAELVRRKNQTTEAHARRDGTSET